MKQFSKKDITENSRSKPAPNLPTFSINLGFVYLIYLYYSLVGSFIIFDSIVSIVNKQSN